jgi:hypothetical protein
MKSSIGKIEVKDRDGKVAILKYNEPRPDLDIKPISPQLVDLRTDGLGLASLRVRIETLLDHSCGERRADRIKDMGDQADQAASILVKIIERGKSCSTCADRRAKAVFALGYFSNAEAVSCLTQLAENKSESLHIRVKAINALGYIGSDSSIEILSRLIKNSKSEAIQRSIVYALGASRSVKAIPVMEGLINKIKAPLIKRQVYASISHLEKFHHLPSFHKRPGLEDLKISTPKKLHNISKLFTNGHANY